MDGSENTILLVDDELGVLNALERLLVLDDYRVLKANSPAAALDLLRRERVGVVVSDQRMPGMDGCELLGKVLEIAPDSVRILLTAYADVNTFMKSVNIGKAARIMLKPWNDALFKSVVADAFAQYNQLLENRRLQSLVQSQNQAYEELNGTFERLLGERTKALKNSEDNLKLTLKQFVVVLSELMETHAETLRGHGRRVAYLSHLLGEELGLPPEQLELLDAAAYLHDLGMVSLPEQIAMTPDDMLNHEDRKILKRHPVVGGRILKGIPGFEYVARLVIAHHEDFDGGGYPEGLKGKNIPLGARIIHVADLFDRHLYPGGAILFQNRATAMDRVAQAAGKELDPEVAKVFVERCYQRTGELDGEEIELSPASLRPGMVLSRDIFNVNEVILLKEGTSLTANHISKLSIHEGFDPVLSRAFVRRRSVHLPELQPGVVAVHPEEGKPRPAVVESPLVVVVDDEKMVVEALRRELLMDDYEVEAFTDPLRVCPFIRENAGKVMAVISDLKMPGLDGVGLAEAIHGQWPSLPVVVITAHATVDSVLGLKRSEVLRVLTKPWDKFELLKILGDLQAARAR